MTQESPISPPEADPHLSAEGLTDQLKHRSARGGAMMIASYAIQLVVGIGGTAVLARLLTPTDFGYLAMVATFLGIVMTLREFIMAPAVQREELSHEQASGLFWLNGLASAVVAVGVAVMAPLLAWFFHEPKVLAVTLVMAVGVLVSMLGMMHQGLLRRQMRFGAISVIEIGAVVAGVVVGVATALSGAQYWALVWQQLTLWGWQTGAAWMFCNWRPALPSASVFHRDEGIRSMLRYGQSATASRVLSYLSRNIDSVLVGHFMGAKVLGPYQKAYQWSMMPFWQIFIPMFPVAVASLSRLQNDPPRYRVYARTTLMALFSITLPGTALLMVEADHVVLLLMGNRWLDAIPLMQILSVGAWCSAFTVTTSWLYLSEGRTAEQFRWSVASAPITIIGVATGLYWGAIGVASGFTIAMIVQVVPAIWYCLRRSPVTVGDFCGSSWRAAAAAILAGIATWLIRSAIQVPGPVAIQFLVHAGNFGLLYVIGWIALPGGRATWREFLWHFRELRRGQSA